MLSCFPPLVCTPLVPGAEPSVKPQHHVSPQALLSLAVCCFITHSPAGCIQSYCLMEKESSTDAGAPAGAAAAVAAEEVVCLGEEEGPCPGDRASSPSRTYRR